MKCRPHVDISTNNYSGPDYRNISNALADQFAKAFKNFTEEKDRLEIARYITKLWIDDVLKESTDCREIQETRKQYDIACDHRYLVTPFSEELKMDQHIIDLLNSYPSNIRTLKYTGPVPSYDTIQSVRYKFLGWNSAERNIDLHDIEMDRAYAKASEVANSAIKNIMKDLDRKSEDGLQFRSLL